MDRRLPGRKMHRRLPKGLLQICLLFIAIWMNMPTTTYGDVSEGFLSIYCGAPSNINFTDIGLVYETDVNTTYIMTGVSSTELNSTGQFYFRNFPEPRNKYCYELPTAENTRYLFRAWFYLDYVMSLPIQFIVSINATNVFTVTYDSDSQYNTSNAQEVIFYSPGSMTYVCLQPVYGVAFVTFLELRPLDSRMYSYSGNERQYMVTLIRYNIGAPPSNGIVRYPYDLNDRFWFTPPRDWADFFPNVNASTAPDSIPRPEVNNVPPIVMKDAWGGVEVEVINYNFFPTETMPMYFDQSEYAYVVVYVENLNKDSAGGSMTVALDSDPGTDVSVNATANMFVNPNFVLSGNAIEFVLTSQEDPSIVTMNALEALALYNFNFSTTADDVTISVLKVYLSLDDWQGDACTPVPHDWLSCALTPTVATSDSGVCHKGDAKTSKCAGEQGFLRSDYSVTSLNLSNLPTSGFDLLLNASKSSFIRLPNLNEMYITDSNVTFSRFELLVNYFIGAELTLLDFTNNSIDSLPVSTNLAKLLSLSLPFNLFSGDLGAFDSAPFNSSLQELNLSYNAMVSLPTTWKVPPNSLTVLDLSHNKFASEISSLDALLEHNDNLQELYVSDNNFTGAMSSLYFSALPNLTLAVFDGNLIGGTLNLSGWFAWLQTVTPNNASPFIPKLLSFVNNSISDIFPSAKDMESVINKLRTTIPDFSKNGILLGGNPFCKGATSEAQQFLCRSTIYDPITKPDSSKKTILIIGVTSGVIAFVLFCITVATVWKLRKQVYALREIEQALANQQVQPPFYKRGDLKLATRDFHKDNKLGRGGFGEVYMGVLPDNTSLAVKKLFNSQQQSVLNEFLNEVVLITGIKHKNLVQLKGCCIEDKQRMLIFEYVEKGNLAQALWGSKVHGGLDWEQRFKICVGVARGLSYLHEELQPSIIHRDIKPENILLDKNFLPKIADFGLARHFSDESSQALYTNVAGTLGYFSPEYATQGQLSDKLDVYSYGIVVLEIVSGRKCIDYSLHPDEVFLKDWVHRMHKKGLLLDTLQPELRDDSVTVEVIRVISIGLWCVHHDPDMRPSMSQVVTMLAGHIDVNIPVEELGNSQSHFKNLLVTTDQQLEFPALPTVQEEESIDFPLVNSGFDSSSGGSSSRTSSKPLIEMSSLVGR